MKTNKLKVQALLSPEMELCLLIKKDISKVQTSLKALKKRVDNMEKQILKVKS